MTRPLIAALAVAGLLGCGGPGAAPAAGTPTSSAAANRSSPDSEGASPATVRARLGDVALELEVADDPPERAQGLMGRTEVPPGTGMLFRFEKPVRSAFYMYRVPVPLHAAFVLDGRVVFTVVMPPCEEAEPQDCPTYGPETPFDTVVETSPETAADVRVGDTLVIAD